jgi:hypothetical protein
LINFESFRYRLLTFACLWTACEQKINNIALKPPSDRRRMAQVTAKRKFKKPVDKAIWRQWDADTERLRARMAGRSAAKVLYDDCVVGFMAAGLSPEGAIIAANQSLPSEACELTPETENGLVEYYTLLTRVSFLDHVRETLESQAATQPRAS